MPRNVGNIKGGLKRGFLKSFNRGPKISKRTPSDTGSISRVRMYGYMGRFVKQGVRVLKPQGTKRTIR